MKPLPVKPPRSLSKKKAGGGNPEVIKMLEDALKAAKAGETLAIGLISVAGMDACSCTWVGGYPATLVMGAASLKNSIMAAVFVTKV